VKKKEKATGVGLGSVGEGRWGWNGFNFGATKRKLARNIICTKNIRPDENLKSLPKMQKNLKNCQENIPHA